MSRFCCFALCIGVVLALFSTCNASKYISDMMGVYRKILDHARPGNNDIVDVESLKTIMRLSDSDSDGRCYGNCEAYLRSIVGDGITWDRLNQIVELVYGDQISDDPYQPQEVHIATTADISAMKVMWATMSGLDKPFVEYVSERDGDWSKSKRVSALSYTYDVPQKWWPVFTGLIYETDMVNLIPNMKYRYRVGGWDNSNSTMRYSQEFSFKAAPEIHPNRKTVISTLADHGTFMLFGFATVNKMLKLIRSQQIDPDLVFVAGDLSYAGLSSAMPILDISKEDEFEHIWDLLGIQNEPVAANIPWMVGAGNHEHFYDYSAFRNRFKMPQNHNLGSNGNFWYDFDYGNVHWISISSEHDLNEGSPQRTFLINSLEAATKNRENVPWIVFSIHKPLYCSSFENPTNYATLLEDLLLKYDVDLLLTGHVHLYERIHPVYKNEVLCYPSHHQKKHLDKGRPDVYRCDGKGPVQVIQGNSGGMQEEKWVQPQPAWSAIRFANGFVPLNRSSNTLSAEGDVTGMGPIGLRHNYTDTFGFGVFTAHNKTHLHYEAFADTENDLGTDSFWIIKRLD